MSGRGGDHRREIDGEWAGAAASGKRRPLIGGAHGQPGIPRFREFPSLTLERPANGGLFYLLKLSSYAIFERARRKLPKVSSRIQ